MMRARPAAIEPFRRSDPAEDVWFVPRDAGSVSSSPIVVLPTGCDRLDAGVTLALVVDDDGTSIREVAVGLDVVRRDVPDVQAALARSYPTHTPIGTGIPVGDVGDLDDLRLTFSVDGHRRQDARVGDLVVSPQSLLGSITRRVTLNPGDIVLTGSPPGLALDQGEGWLTAGCELVATIEGMGELVATVIPQTEASQVEHRDPAGRDLASSAPRVFVTGTNYASHVAEMGGTAPPFPTASLMKLPTAHAASGDEIHLPPDARVDYEGEIAIVLGADARNVDADRAEEVIAGLCLANDVSARDAPMTHLLLAKNAPGFGPLGALVPIEQVTLDTVTFTVSVNGRIRQRRDSADMIHSIRQIVASYSAALPMHAGDVILTGSPAGVGVAQDPPIFLEPGDTVIIESPELGTLSNRFVASTRSPSESVDQRDAR